MIDAASLRLKKGGAGAGEIGATAPAGVASVSLTFRAAIATANVQLQLYVNGELRATSATAGTTNTAFAATGLAATGATAIRVLSTGAGEVVLDDIVVTSNP